MTDHKRRCSAQRNPRDASLDYWHQLTRQRRAQTRRDCVIIIVLTLAMILCLTAAEWIAPASAVFDTM